MAMILEKLFTQGNPLRLTVGTAFINTEYYDNLQKNMVELVSYHAIKKTKNYTYCNFSDEVTMGIIKDGQELISRIIYYFLLDKRKKLKRTEKCLVNGIQMFFDMHKSFHNEKEFYLQQYDTNIEIFRKSLDRIILDEDINWVHICALFATCVKFAGCCQSEQKQDVLKIVPFYFKLFLNQNKNILNFIFNNGGWVSLF